MSFVTVARVGDIPPGSARQVGVNGHLCLHRGGPLCEGAVRGSVVTRVVGDEIQVRLTD